MSVQLQLGAATVNLEGVSARVFAGRDPAACQLAHMDATLSRRHAEVWVENGNAFIRDLGSANGTWVNGTHLGHEPVALAPGQQIYLGHVPLGVTWGIDGSKTAMAKIRAATIRLPELATPRCSTRLGNCRWPAELSIRSWPKARYRPPWEF